MTAIWGESGNEIVFMAKGGVTEITMDAKIMPSKSVEYITSFLERIEMFHASLDKIRN